MATHLEELAKDPDMPPAYTLLIGKLLAMLGGSREAELWMDEGLYYRDAVEIKMLVEEGKMEVMK